VPETALLSIARVNLLTWLGQCLES